MTGPRIDFRPLSPQHLADHGTPAAATGRPGGGLDTVDTGYDAPSWLAWGLEEAREIRAAVRPKLAVIDRSESDRSHVIGLSFDRPVDRDTAIHQLYESGQLPRNPSGAQAHESNVQLLPRGGESPATQWDLVVPKTDRAWPWAGLRPGVMDELWRPGVSERLPSWIPTTSADLIRRGAVPPPADTPGLEVRSHGDVTTWREGRCTFRYDARTGVVEGYRASADPDLAFFEEERAHLVHGEGRSLKEAEAIIEKRYRHVQWSYMAPHMEKFEL